MSILENILSNGFILIIPILVWNFLFTSKLPKAFDPKIFNSKIPHIILGGENLFRFIIFLMPLLLRFEFSVILGKFGFYVFIVGVLSYFLSWIALIYRPDSIWSNSIFGFAAPAYTPLIWLVGVGLLADSYYFSFSYSKWHYIIPSVLFSVFHITHTVLVHKKTINYSNIPDN